MTIKINPSILFQVDEKSDQHGGEIIGQVLKAHGVEHIFTLQSRTRSPILKGAEKNGIKVIETKHEVTAVSAADASSRLTGLPGIALVSCAPGLTNTIAAVKAAVKAESALVLIGQASSAIMKEEHLEITNQLKTLKPFLKWQGKVTRIRDIAYELREALRQALHGTPGPVYIQFNLDVLHPFPVVKKELDRMGSNWWLNYYIQNLFAAGFDVGREIRPWPIEIPFPKKELVAKVVKNITKSEKPVIIVGSQASLPPIEEAKMATILQELGVPTFCTGTASGLLPKTAPITMRHGMEEAIEGADLVLLLGVPSEFKSTTGGKSDKLVYTVNRNKATLKANCSNFGTSTFEAIHSDVGQFLVEVNEKIGRFAISQEWVTQLRERNLKGDRLIRESNPVGAAIEDSLPDGSVIITDGSDFATNVSSCLGNKGTFLDSPTSAKLGASAGYAMGAKLAKPDSVVCCLREPGTMNYVMSELSTCTRNNIALLNITAIGNVSGQVTIVDPSTGVTITNLQSAAEDSGCKGITVAAGDVKGLKGTFDRAVTLSREGNTVLVNVLGDK